MLNKDSSIEWLRSERAKSNYIRLPIAVSISKTSVLKNAIIYLYCDRRQSVDYTSCKPHKNERVLSVDPNVGNYIEIDVSLISVESNNPGKELLDHICTMRRQGECVMKRAVRGRNQDFSKGGGGSDCVKHYRHGVLATEYYRLFS